jgi:hypothetical protein
VPAKSSEPTSEITTNGIITVANPFYAVSHPLEDVAEMEEALDIYRTNMVPYFPVVIIEDDVKMSNLRNTRPFLSLVIRAIATRNLTRQASLGIEIRRVLGREMLFEATKSLDLLLGLLVYCSWSHFYIYSKHIKSTSIQLAMALAFDLGITRPVPSEPRHTLVLPTTNAEKGPNIPRRAPRTMEERRAVLGLFLISSVLVYSYLTVPPYNYL